MSFYNDLDRYLSERGIKTAAFAYLLQQVRKHDSKPTRGMVRSWRIGERIPSHDSRRFIEVASGGAVAMDSWPDEERVSARRDTAQAEMTQ